MRRVVIVRSDAKLGEILLATPVCQALKETRQGIWIEVWSHPKWNFVIAGSRWIDSVQSVPFRPPWKSCGRIVQKLKATRPDAILILRPNTFRYSFLAAMARVPLRAGIAPKQSLTGRLLTHIASINPLMHQVERNLAVAETLLGCSLPRYPLHFAPAHPATLPAEVQALPEKGYAVLHVSTGGVQPRWLPERFAAVADYLAQEYELIPVLSGVSDDLPISERCDECAQEPLLNLTGRLTILELAEVLRRARLLVSVDTGVVHLAAAVGTPCVSLHFRRDYPPHQWRAWLVPNEIVVPSEYCADCTLQQCRLNSARYLHCVNSLGVESVLDAVKRLLHRC